MRAAAISNSKAPIPGKRFCPVFDRQTVANVVLLSLTFVASLRVNGELHRIPTPVLLLLLVPNILTMRLKTGTLVAFVTFVTLTIFHLMWLDGSGRIPFSVSDVLTGYALYVGLIAVYIASFFTLTWGALEQDAVAFFKLMTVIGLGFWILSIGTGSSVGVDVSHSTPRLQSLVTEPSNTSHFLPGLLIYCLWRRQWGWSIISGVALLCTLSPTVYLVLVFTAILLWSLAARPLRVLVVVSICVMAVMLMVNNYTAMIAVLSEGGGLGQAAARILEGFSFISSAGEVGANSRAALIFAGVDFMNTYSLWWSGAGFGTSAYIGDAFNDGLLFDSNTWASLVIWFGVLVLPVWLFVQYLAVRKKEKSFMYILLVSLCVSNTLNSGGIWLQMFFVTLVFLKLRQDFRMRIL